MHCSLFHEIDDLSFQFYIVQPVDTGYASRADTVDFRQIVSDDVDPHKIEAVFNQTVFDCPADFLFPIRHFMFEYMTTGVNIGPEISFFGFTPHGAQNLSI